MAILFNSANDRSLIASVMVIDDQHTSRIIFETVLQSIGTNIKVSTYDNPVKALAAAQNNPPDLIIVDYKMPLLNGVEFTKRVRSIPDCHDIPIIIITVMDERSIRYEALEAGATDFLTKPVDHYECKVRCKNLLTMRRQQIIIRNRANYLEKQISDAIEKIHTREKETLLRLARAGEYRDTLSGRQSGKLGMLAGGLAQELGMDREFCEIIKIAAPLHDIGKIGIPDNILFKKESLNKEEMEVMKTHTLIGHDILKESPSPYLKMGATIALYHHEKYDGSGYPYGLEGVAIPIEARIVALADVFDAIISERPYSDPMSIQAAIKEIGNLNGEHFDPACVNILCNHIDKFAYCGDQSETRSAY